jgi:hypothetical protein
MSPRRLAAFLLLVSSMLVLAACGGSDDSDKGGDRGYVDTRGYSAPLVGSKSFKIRPSLVPDEYATAGNVVIESYEPTGEIVADSGFRPQADGFSFENYGNDQRPTNLTNVSMQNLFGQETVCLGGSSGTDCVLTPAAQAWMENANNAMSGGHCEGFSMAALRMYADKLQPDEYGAARPVGLRIRGNDDLQATIAEHFMYQALPSVLDNQVHGTPMDIVDALRASLSDGSEQYTLGIYKPDRTGGHAITPFAIEDRGDNQFAILVYDNNFPGATRAVEVDGNENTWSYVGGTNPKDLGQVYEGNADTNTLELDPLTPGIGEQPCIFCNAEQAKGAGKGSLLPAGDRYTEITLQGDPANHPHLVFEDEEGRKTGIVDGEFVDDIPEVEVVSTAAIENWDSDPEPRYRFPEGRQYLITLDGTHLEKRARPTVNLVGAGLVIEVEDITIEPGQSDRMQLAEGYGLTYETNNDTEEAPNLFAGVTTEDEAYIFAASAVGIAKGSAISLFVVQDDKVVILDSTGSAGKNGKQAKYVTNLTKLTADGKTTGWTKIVDLNGAKGEKIGFEYDETAKPGQPLPLIYVGGDGEPTGKVELAEPEDVS